METTTGITMGKIMKLPAAKKSEFRVEIEKRVDSPYHDTAYILEKVTGASTDEVFYSKKVQRLIAKTPGKEIGVFIFQRTKSGEKNTSYFVNKVYGRNCLVQYKLDSVLCGVYDDDGNEIGDTVKLFSAPVKPNNSDMRTTTGTTEPEFKGDVLIMKKAGRPACDTAYVLKNVAGAGKDEVFYSKKIQKLIAKTPGKKINVSLIESVKSGEQDWAKYTDYIVKKVYRSEALVQYKLVEVGHYILDGHGNTIDDDGNVIDSSLLNY